MLVSNLLWLCFVHLVAKVSSYCAARAIGVQYAAIDAGETRAMTEQEYLAAQLEEARRLIAYLQDEVERNRAINGELRKAVADVARTFQESLAAAYEAGESGDIERVRVVTRANQRNWQAYRQQIIRAAQRAPSMDEGDGG